MLTHRTVPFWLSALRIAVGFSWLVTGFEKVVNPSYGLALKTMLTSWAAQGNGGLHAFMVSTILPNVDALSFALKAFELLVGLSLVLGLLAPLAAFGGFAIVAAAWFLKQSFASIAGFEDGNFVVMATMLFLTVTPSGRYFGLDGTFFRRREPAPIIATG
jgi:uncharacterized membrane protein YphA (DoxX/SURF4 family)